MEVRHIAVISFIALPASCNADALGLAATAIHRGDRPAICEPKGSCRQHFNAGK
jgi:hypothetical protein